MGNLGGSRWRNLKAQALRRDMRKDARCWICGGRIDYRAEPGTPDAWEPDHIKPRSKYPELTYDITNLAPSHCSCNRSRKDRSAQETLGLGVGTQSRDWGV